MSMTPAEVERKVHQHDNDIQSIYEMLSTIHGTQQRHGNRLSELGESVTRLDDKVTRLDDKVTRLDDKVTGLVSNMDTVLEILRAR